MTLDQFIPSSARGDVKNLLSRYPLEIRMVNQRRSKHGDYRLLPSGKHLITLNAHPNPYRVLITLLHEIAHYVAFNDYGYRIKPHGREWKNSFRKVSLMFLSPVIFPTPLLGHFAHHLKNPKASSDTDFNLAMALSEFDPISNKTYIFELEEGTFFSIADGRKFRLGKRRVKRFECQEISTQKKYIFYRYSKYLDILFFSLD